MSDEKAKGPWIEDLEIEDAQVKWAFSHFDGRKDLYNEDGQFNFVLLLDEDTARRAMEDGWAVKEKDGYEEGDPPEFQLKVNISYKFEAPKIFLIKNGRKFRADERDLPDISRATCERIDVILTPSRWVNGQRTGISAYAKELYATVKASRFSERYADFEEA